MNKSFFTTLTAKAIGVGILAFLLLIPVAFVSSLVSERENRLREVASEVGRSYGYPQVLAGPVLAIPYKVVSVSSTSGTDTKEVQTTKQEKVEMAYFLPKKLDITANIEPEIRSRGIFEAVVYKAKTEFKGDFHIDPKSLGIAPDALQLENARLLVDITDGRGIEKTVPFIVNGKPSSFSPGNSLFHLGNTQIGSGTKYSSLYYQAPMPTESGNGLSLTGIIPNYKGEDISFSFELPFKGSEQLDIAPLGVETVIHISGNWAKPSFIGDLLPIKSSMEENTFSADWNVSEYGRSAPSAFVQGTETPRPNMVAIKLLSPIDFYAKTDRTVKYALLFIGLTFIAFFLIEVLRKMKVHPLQYVLVGFALALFFLLLLAGSEYIGFDLAYAFSAGATILLISLYCGNFLGGVKEGFLIGALLSGLYIYLYLLLLLEEKSLLFGAVGLFIILGSIMYLTRNINWYELSQKTEEEKV